MNARPTLLRSLALGVVISTSVALATFSPAEGKAPRVLRVGTFHGIAGQYTTIQSAVNAAKSGDWILVAPGDYHELGSTGPELSAGVLIQTPGIRLRGMNRNSVIVDGTKPRGPACSPDPTRQRITKQGLNGIEVWEADGVHVSNLTVCNYLNGTGNGNQIWWNGGDGTGQIHLGRYDGSYLTATSTYWGGTGKAKAQYGIFVSNSDGPGVIAHTYSSNMADSAYYIGACPDCNAVLTDAHAQNSALGYSGTNAGGHLIIENSEWDHNRTGIAPNSLNNDDAPPPQNGHCPGTEKGPTGTVSCTVIRGNYVHDNNNPNVPSAGIAGQALIGGGIEISGGQYDTIVHNHIVHEGSWGIAIHDFPDTETPPPTSHCQGGVQANSSTCLFQSNGNETAGNVLERNGFFGNPGNADLGNEAGQANPGNCFHGNTDPKGLTSDPQNIEQVDGNCGGPSPGDQSLAGQMVCASGIEGQCPAGSSYPQATHVAMFALKQQPTMPNPCAGVPANPWCPGGHPARSHLVTRSSSASGTIEVAPRRRSRPLL